MVSDTDVLCRGNARISVLDRPLFGLYRKKMPLTICLGISEKDSSLWAPIDHTSSRSNFHAETRICASSRRPLADSMINLAETNSEHQESAQRLSFHV